LYLAPNNSYVLRHDQSMPLGQGWTKYKLSTMTDGTGAVFDGRYVYFPGQRSPSGGVVARFDTTGNFQSAWVEAPTPGSAVYGGGRFDGRRVIFAPDGAGPAIVYDTSTPFTASASIFTSQALQGSVSGTAFDGEYVYFVPADTSTPFQRFHTRSAPAATTTGGSTY
jgi:hypothetical protein